MGRIDYINASPVYYGLDHGLLPAWVTMTDGPPAVLNRMIRRGDLSHKPHLSWFLWLPSQGPSGAAGSVHLL